MRKIVQPLLVLIFINMFAIQIFAFDVNDKWQMHVTNELEFMHNDVWGQGQDNSFLSSGNGDNGWSFEERIDLLNRIKLGDVLYEFDANLRFTNDQRIDNEDATLLKTYFKRESPYTLIRLGDFFANFSQYSLNQNLKGTLLNLKSFEGNPWDFSILGGSYKSRWEYIWNDKAAELKNTYFYGFRVGREIEKLEAHLNYVYTDDDRLGNRWHNTSRATAEIVHNHLGSIDWKFRPTAGLDLSGESAFSRQHSTTQLIDFGVANKFRARTRIRDLRTQFEYEITPSDFNTPGGSASSDRERYRLRNTYYLKNSEVFANYTTYWDNTQDTLSTTTRVDMPEAGLTVRNLLKRKTLSSTLRARHKRRHKANHSQDERTNTLNWSLEDRFGAFRPGVEYEFRRTNPRKDPNDSGEKTHALILRVNSYHRSDAWTLRPSISMRFEQTKDLGVTSGRGTNKDWIWSGGISGNYKKDLRFNLASTYMEADNYSLDSDSERRTFRASVDYNIKGSRDNVVRVEYQGNRNAHSKESSEYKENIWKMKWTRKF